MILIITILTLISCGPFVGPSSVPRGEYGEIKLFQSPATYSVESMVLLNDAGKQDKEIGYKIAGSLDVQVVWGVDSDLLIKFTLNSPKLLARGKLVTADYLPIKSIWDPYYKTEFYAHWRNGIITEAYLNPDEVSDVLNYKKSLISLFQLQIIDGEHNETDVSGNCDVLYDSISMQVIRKIKSHCKHPDTKDSTEGIKSRRLTRYTLNEKLDAIDEIHAEELHTAGYEELNAAIKARAWMRLRRDGVPRTTATKYNDLESALAELPSDLKPVALPMLMIEDIDDDDVDLEEAVNAVVGEGEDEAAGGGGTAGAALAGLRALRALRNASRDQIAALLRAQTDATSLTALCRVLGAAGAAAAHAAVSRELPLAERDAPPSVIEYLNALALAHAPDDSVVLDVLRLGAEARAGAVREAALLAAAAAAAAPHLAHTVRDALTKQLARCLDDDCRALVARALGNLQRADTADLLLELAERGGAALHALQALQALPHTAITPDKQRRLAALAASIRPLEVRAAALDLFLTRTAPLPHPLVLARLSRELHVHAPAELRRLFWQRATQLAQEHKPLADVLEMLDPEQRGWNALALPGTSSSLVREVGVFGVGGARLESLQLAARGVLRRGTVRLRVHAAPTPLLAIELWTRGLESLAGGAESAEGGAEGAEGGAEEEMGGGLVLTVGGARLPGVTLFDGQAQLLGQVWSGAGSSATPALRALQPLGARRVVLPLLAAGLLQLRADAAVALALDAQAQVSLWSRTALAQAAVRGGAAGEARAALRLRGGALRAAARFAAEPRLNVAAHLDFYDRTTLCVTVSTEHHLHSTNTTLYSELGSAPRTVRRQRLLTVPQPGRTLALGALNDAACNTLLT
ncbi:PREDICTED: microsomal triglyceride transfer protein large subunit [Papilio polytes]|uniref:microsomal triglyceride transfer protein large subunit n=1 Tax=Papilio polytes TaxID=76194 RepID=UPI000675C789|nr:PREDICTED: microsomal triglyceride transfer protein large subunit [Papilio polytes]